MEHYATVPDWSKRGLPGPLAVGAGRTAVRLELLAQGRDLVLLIGGGEVHAGAAAVARPGGSPAGDVVIPPHKEGPLAVECASLLAEAGGCACVAVAGIHQDAATGEEIAAVCANVRQGARALAAAVRGLRRGELP